MEDRPEVVSSDFEVDMTRELTSDHLIAKNRGSSPVKILLVVGVLACLILGATVGYLLASRGRDVGDSDGAISDEHQPSLDSNGQHRTQTSSEAERMVANRLETACFTEATVRVHLGVANSLAVVTTNGDERPRRSPLPRRSNMELLRQIEQNDPYSTESQ